MGFSFFIRENYTLLYETITYLLKGGIYMLNLRAKTEQMIDKMNGLMDKVTSKVTLRDIKNIGADELEMFQESMELYELSCEIAMKQAEIIESLDKKTDELLEMNRKLLERSKGL